MVISKVPPTIAVTGIIIPERWDNNGNVIGVSIQAFDESEYIVETNRQGRELFEFIHQKVEITGKVFEGLDGKLTIEVDRFNVIDS